MNKIGKVAVLDPKKDKINLVYHPKWKLSIFRIATKVVQAQNYNNQIEVGDQRLANLKDKPNQRWKK